MALVSYRKKFIFLKTSKTAGTSIEGFLERYCLPPGEFAPQHARPETITEAGIIGARPGRTTGNPRFWSHMSAEELKGQVGDDLWEEYYKISVVRDPYDKVVSSFFFIARKSGEEFKDAAPEEVRCRFREFVKAGNLPIDRDKYTIAGRLCADFVIRYETLADDLGAVSERLGLEYNAEALPSYKAGIRPTGHRIEDLYDNETANIVEQTYRFEFKTFDYPLLSDLHPGLFRRQLFSLPAQAHFVRKYLRSVAKRLAGNGAG
ncbi:MAG: sulfotransferase family protein [Alphaproteobacteria bacterium]|nr:sulfotransferase family protein [Alphaproteobacteria bacterium]